MVISVCHSAPGPRGEYVENASHHSRTCPRKPADTGQDRPKWKRNMFACLPCGTGRQAPHLLFRLRADASADKPALACMFLPHPVNGAPCNRHDNPMLHRDGVTGARGVIPAGPDRGWPARPQRQPARASRSGAGRENKKSARQARPAFAGVHGEPRERRAGGMIRAARSAARCRHCIRQPGLLYSGPRTAVRTRFKRHRQPASPRVAPAELPNEAGPSLLNRATTNHGAGKQTKYEPSSRFLNPDHLLTRVSCRLDAFNPASG